MDSPGAVEPPPRGAPAPGRGGDPYGYGRDGYPDDPRSYPDDPRSARSYPADPYARDSYGRGADDRMPDDRMRDDRMVDPYGRDDRGYGARDDRTPNPPYSARDDRGYPPARGGEPDMDPYSRGHDDRGYPPADSRGPGGYGPHDRGTPDPDRGRGYRDGGYGYGDPLGSPGPDPARADRGGADRYLPCPNCRALYEPGARFCETCGLDFTTGHLPASSAGAALSDPGATVRQTGPRHGVDPRRGDPHMSDPRLDDPHGPSRGRQWDSPPPGNKPVVWEAIVEAEREYYESGDDHRVPFPTFYPRRVFQLTEPQMLIGRRSESRGIHPEIDLSGAPEDPGISRAHATLERQPDGSYAVRDPGSTNGTRINDEPEPIEQGRAVPLRDGDRVYLGAWTRITLRAR